MTKQIKKKRIDIDSLPDFDAAQYLDNKETIAAFLTDILEANNAALLASALGDIARARGMTEIAKAAGMGAVKTSTKRSALTALPVSTPSTVSAPPSVFASLRNPLIPPHNISS